MTIEFLIWFSKDLRVGCFTYLNSIRNYKNNILTICTKLKIKVNSYANNELHQVAIAIIL